MRNLTPKQIAVLQRIDVVREQTSARLLADCPGCTPTEYVSVYRLVRIHKQDRRVIDALIAKGWLEARPTSWQGLEVRRASNGQKI